MNGVVSTSLIDMGVPCGISYKSKYYYTNTTMLSDYTSSVFFTQQRN